MEVSVAWIGIKLRMRMIACTCLFFLAAQIPAAAQSPGTVYTIKKGQMYIEVSRTLGDEELDNFITDFNLSGLGLKHFVRNNNADSLKANGWEINLNTKERIAIAKPLLSAGDINNLAHFDPHIASRFPSVQSGQVMGYNKFRKKRPFSVTDSMVRFFMRNNKDAKQVMLAGSFNLFSPSALPMKKTDSGWIADVRLSPGKYWYKFVSDGKWYEDNDNELQENDGLGNTNSVYYKTNTVFHLDGHFQAKRVYVAGSFNNWDPNELLMHRTNNGWELPVYLADGTYTYRFVADRKWFIDSANSARRPNEFNEFNSEIKIGKPEIFRLQGFPNASKVYLTGSFNGWRKGELLMKKTETGWELPYTLGMGNYEYRFVVDGVGITDPGNPLFTSNSREKGNSVLILGANHTFTLKGFPNAKEVYLAGDFNEFNPKAYAMTRKGNDWIFTVHLSIGKHLYKYVVDGVWTIDPNNKLWEQNEYGTGDSVIWIESQQ